MLGINMGRTWQVAADRPVGPKVIDAVSILLESNSPASPTIPP